MNQHRNEDWSQQYMRDPNKKPNYKMRRAVAAALIGPLVGATASVVLNETVFKPKGKESEPSGAVPAFVQGVEYTVTGGETPSSIDTKANPDSKDNLANGDKMLASEPRDEFHQGGLRPGDKVVYVGNTKFKPSDEVQKVLVARELEGKAPFVIPIMPNNGEIVPKEYGVAAEFEDNGQIKVVPSGPPPPPTPEEIANS